MAYHLLSRSRVRKNQLSELQNRLEFRKATPSMMMAAQASEDALSILGPIDKNQMSVVLGSNLGELETTLEFLKTFYESKLARPMLFQNSLHNAILGFLTIHLGLRGPSTTISLEEKTFEASLRATQLLLEETPYVLFVSSEFGHEPLNEILKESSMKAWKEIELAEAFVFTKDSGLVQSGKTPLISYENILDAKSLADWLR